MMCISEIMQDIRAKLLVVIVAISAATTFSASESAVFIERIDSFSGDDLGLEGAELSPNRSLVLAYGVDSKVILFSSEDPAQIIEMPSIGQESLNDAGFHPGGKSAIIVGDNGTILRYSDLDNSLTVADNNGLEGYNLSSVTWNPSGSWAYIGSDEGEIWRFRSSGDGGSEIHPLNGTEGIGPITSIDCSLDSSLCVVSTSYSGIAVIQRDHSMNWIGGFSTNWFDLECSDLIPSCIVISAEILGTVELSPSNPEESTVGGVEIVGIDGIFTGISILEENRFLISLAPFSIIEHDMEDNATYPWLGNLDVSQRSVQLSGESVVYTWGTGSDSGWILTDRGSFASFHPLDETSQDSVFSNIVLLGVILAISGMIITFFMSISDIGKGKQGNIRRKGKKLKERRRKR